MLNKNHGGSTRGTVQLVAAKNKHAKKHKYMEGGRHSSRETVQRLARRKAVARWVR